MTRLDLVLIVLGGYLAAGMLIAAWQRSPRATGGVAPWVAFSGLWAIAACDRWVSASWPVALALGPAWGVLGLLLTRAGVALARRAPVRQWIWLLGPVHACALAGLWLADWRHRRAAPIGARQDPAEALIPDPGAAERMGEALESVVELGRTTVDEVMVPRSEIDALADTATVADWVRLARESRHPYLPVYGEDLDEIRGFLGLHDLFSASAPQRPVTDFLREARFVPESMRCDDLLRDLLAAGERWTSSRSCSGTSTRMAPVGSGWFPLGRGSTWRTANTESTTSPSGRGMPCPKAITRRSADSSWPDSAGSPKRARR